MTNAEKIRGMTDIELAEALIDRVDFYYENIKEERWIGDFWGVRYEKDDALEAELEWLKSEVKE